MQKIGKDIYTHRGYGIFRGNQGIWVENHLELFPTWTDARAFIDKLIDGANRREPRIIGEWSEEKRLRLGETQTPSEQIVKLCQNRSRILEIF